MLHRVVRQAKASKLLGIGVEYHLVLARRDRYAIALEGLHAIPVEDKHQVTALVCHYLIALVVAEFILPWQVHAITILHRCQVLTQEVYHLLIKEIQTGEEVTWAIHQTPLTAGILMAPTIALAREVNPFGVTELVTHESEITAIDGRSSNKANHLVQRDTAVHHIGRVTFLEVPIHIRIAEAEDDGLVAYQCLVMALGIGDGLLILTAVGHLIEDMSRLPVLVAHLFDILNPEIWNTHCQSVVKAHTAVLDRISQTRHTRHIFGDGDGVLLHLVYEFVSKSEVANCVAIFVAVVVARIVHKVLTQTVALIHH